MTIKGFQYLVVWICVINLLIHVSCKKEEEKIKANYLPLTESVYSSVVIQPDSMYAVYASVGGVVEEVYVTEGDIVRKDDKLVHIGNNSVQLNAEKARLSLELSKSKYDGEFTILREVQHEMYNARLKLKDDSLMYIRQESLWQKKIGSKNEYEDIKLKYDISRNNVKLLVNKYDRIHNELESQYKQAVVKYENSRSLNKDYTINSNIEGKIYKILVKPGELVSAQQPIGYVGSNRHFIIEMSVDEVDIVKVRLGQTILVILDAYRDSVFEGRIHRIIPRMDSRSQTFLVEGKFVAPPSILYSGLTGEANIIISEKRAILTIPLDYLLTEQSVMTEEGIMKVKTGVRNLERVEIISGLDTNSVLIKPK